MTGQRTVEPPRGRDSNSEDQPSTCSLLAALEQNWEHARHEENLRLAYFTFYWVALASAIAFAVEKGQSKGLMALADFWLVFFLLGLVSVFTLLAVIKASEEFRNHVRAAQWIAENLKLNVPVSPGSQPDIMFKGFMALPLPLPIRVNKVFKYLMYIAIVATWAIATAGFMMRMAGLAKEFAITVAVLISGLICWYLHARVEKAEAATNHILGGRQPAGIEIRYPGD